MGSQHRVWGAYSPVRSSHKVPGEWPSSRVLDGTGHYVAWIALLLSTIETELMHLSRSGVYKLRGLYVALAQLLPG